MSLIVTSQEHNRLKEAHKKFTENVVEEHGLEHYYNPELSAATNAAFGIGFDPGIDWLRLTWDKRMVKDAGPYKKVGYGWQWMLDWSLVNFPRIYHQLARGHDKTERESWWALIWGLTAQSGQGFCCGVDKENAQLFRNAAKWQVQQHPRLFKDYSIHNYDIINNKTGAHIKVLASDECSNYGLTPDLLMVTDFHAWTNKEFWEALWTAMGKRPNSRMWVESNALALGTEQVQWIRPIRDYAKSAHKEQQGLPPGAGPENKRWFYYAPPMFLAPWQQIALKEWAGTMLPPSFRRLILNKDSSEGNQYLTEEQVQACEVLRGPTKPREGSNIVVCTDIGITTDAAVVGVISEFKQDNVQYIELNHAAIFTGSRDQPVNIRHVVSIADAWAAQYNCKKYCDPYEMRSIMQEDPTWNEYAFSSKNISNLTTRMWRAFVNKQVRVWPDCLPQMQSKGGGKPTKWDLKRELTEAVLKDMSYGSRVDHKSTGFSDRLITLGMGVDILFQDSPPEERKETVTVLRTVEDKSLGELYDSFFKEQLPGMRII